MKEFPLALTFDDVLLQPNFSEIVSRKEVDTTTYLSKNIRLNIPIVSSNMDTVTESQMAIAMAREGGIGIIHRFLSIDEQVSQVNAVKRSESILIEKPYSLRPDNTLADAISLFSNKSVSGILVVDTNNILKGILTSRDVLFEDNLDKPISDLMTTDLVTGSPDISLEDAKNILKQNKIEKLPLIDDKNRLYGLITIKDIKKSRQWPKATKDKKGRLRVGAAIGVKNEYIARLNALYEVDCDVVVVDVAHGHSKLVIDTIKNVRKQYGDDIELIAGNVASAEGAADLISHGVDGIKVGVGPGSICTTRIVAGAGVPQFSAIQMAASVAHDAGVPIIGDGGIRTSGDITKAIGIGASTVMLGNLLAGTTESPGFPVLRNGRKVKIIRGMASLGASIGREQRTKGTFDDSDFASIAPEGVEAIVPYRGAVSDVLNQLVGGFRSGMSYAGAKTIPELWKLARFVRMTRAGRQESNAHDVETV